MSTEDANPRSFLHPLVRRWRVRGICLVPTEVEMIVEAAGESFDRHDWGGCGCALDSDSSGGGGVGGNL